AALNDDDRGNNSGSAYIFGQDVGTWSQRDKITASDGAAGDKFGVSVSAREDYIVVGAWLNDEKAADAGAAYIFIKDYIYWFELQKLTASDAQAGDKFGYSVAKHSQYVVVGAIGDDDNGSSSGSAYMFCKGANGYWSQQAKLTAPDGQALDKFGCSVSVRDPYAVIGAYWHDDNGTDAGAAYLFKRNGTAWTLSTELNTPNPAPEDYFGLSVSVDNNYVLAGAYGHDQSADNAGAAYMYRLCPETDLNGDCVVDYADLALLAENWLVKIE
ncbi:MAG TPA: FG-GAP repeat protein, partial [Sedimentisphaerales bacterium]|nr:FG-GAP repeat protein [Sedimentisphaerales bacterium]